METVCCISEWVFADFDSTFQLDKIILSSGGSWGIFIACDSLATFKKSWWWCITETKIEKIYLFVYLLISYWITHLLATTGLPQVPECTETIQTVNNNKLLYIRQSFKTNMVQNCHWSAQNKSEIVTHHFTHQPFNLVRYPWHSFAMMPGVLL